MENLELNIANPLKGGLTIVHIVHGSERLCTICHAGRPGAFSGVRLESEPQNAESDMLAGPLKGCSENSRVPERIVKVIKITVSDEALSVLRCWGYSVWEEKIFGGAKTNQMWMSQCANQTLCCWF